MCILAEYVSCLDMYIVLILPLFSVLMSRNLIWKSYSYKHLQIDQVFLPNYILIN